MLVLVTTVHVHVGEQVFEYRETLTTVQLVLIVSAGNEHIKSALKASIPATETEKKVLMYVEST